MNLNSLMTMGSCWGLIIRCRENAVVNSTLILISYASRELWMLDEINWLVTRRADDYLYFSSINSSLLHVFRCPHMWKRLTAYIDSVVS